MNNNSTYLSEAYAAKNESYYSGARKDYVNFLPLNRDGKIIEIGSGNGDTGGLAIKKGRCKEYVGVEMFETVAKLSESQLTKVHIGNVDTIELPYPPHYFDALIMSEVVEHLINPVETLSKLLPLLKPGAFVLTSSPNISHWSSILNLWMGRFDYEEFGLMDRTHLRWFTPNSYREMFESLGVETVIFEPHGETAPWKRFVLRLLAFGKTHLYWYQINYIGKIPNCGVGKTKVG